MRRPAPKWTTCLVNLFRRAWTPCSSNFKTRPTLATGLPDYGRLPTWGLDVLVENSRAQMLVPQEFLDAVPLQQMGGSSSKKVTPSQAVLYPRRRPNFLICQRLCRRWVQNCYAYPGSIIYSREEGLSMPYRPRAVNWGQRQIRASVQGLFISW